MSGIRTLLLVCSLALLLTTPANAYLTDAASHPPPTSGGQAYYDSYGAFGPNQPGFPGKGQSFVDPVFGSTITRLTAETGQQSWSDIYSKNGNFNANNTLMVHNTTSGRQFVNPATGAVVRPSVPGNDNSSFDPVDPDIWWWYAYGGTTLFRYSVSAGTSTAVKTFAEPIGNNGGSIDWIDRTGRYMVFHLGSTWRLYDVQSDVLYANPIPDIYGNNPGYTGITPDGNYIITTQNANPNAHRSWAVNHATRSVATSGVIFWTLCGDHGDFVSASNGRTYWVVFECDSIAAVYAVDVSIPQSHSDKAKQLSDNRQLMKISWSDSGHFSRVSRGPYQDWVFASIESGDDGFGSSVSNWRAFKQEILMVNALTGEVRRLAHHRSRAPFSNYYYQPRVSASWDGTYVAWASNFGLNASGYADIYTIRVDTSGAGGGGGGGPVAVAFTNPGNATLVSGTVTVSVSASGGSGHTYSVKAGGATIYTGTSNAFSWNTAGVGNGNVMLSATVTASDGATGSASRIVTVSNQTAADVPEAALLPSAKAFAASTWRAYGSWETLPQYLKDEAFRMAAASYTPGASAPAGSASLADAQAFAKQTWRAYGSWETLPQYLKDEAFRSAPAGGGGSSSSGASSGSLDAAKAFAASTWTAYGSWDTLPEFLKDEAMKSVGASGSASSDSSSGPGAAAKAFARRTWTAYGSWETLPQFLKDEAIATVGW